VLDSGICIAVCSVLRTKLDLSGLLNAETLLGCFLSTACAVGVTDPIANRSRKYMIYPATRTGDPVLCAAYSATDTCSPDYMIPSFLFNPYCPEAESLGITGPMILEERK
jgi:hypothetical protein